MKKNNESKKNNSVVYFIVGIILVIGLCFAYHMIFFIEIPYATKIIEPRTKITSDMISTKRVQKKLINNNVIVNKNEIIGNYISNTSIVHEGSMFYKEMVVNLEPVSNSINDNLLKGNRAFEFDVDSISTYGNSIFPGNIIDIYYKDKNVFGKFIEDIKVLDVVDKEGNSVFKNIDNSKEPSKLIIGLPNELYELATSAIANGGKLIPVPKAKEMTNEIGITKIVSNELREYLKGSKLKGSN